MLHKYLAPRKVMYIFYLSKINLALHVVKILYCQMQYLYPIFVTRKL